MNFVEPKPTKKWFGLGTVGLGLVYGTFGVGMRQAKGWYKVALGLV